MKEAEQFAEEDKKRKEVIDTRNQADGVILGLEKMLRDSGDKLAEDEKNTLTTAIEQAKKDIQAENVEDIRKALETLSKTTEPIVTKLYQNASANANAGANAGAEGAGQDTTSQADAGDNVNVDPSQNTTDENK